MDDLARLVATVQKSAKYHAIAPALIERIGRAEFDKGRRIKEAVKATKGKLHQITGAYLPDRPPYATWQDELAELHPTTDKEAYHAALRKIMASHASTRERLPILDTFYKTLLDDVPPVQSVLDLACGFNPLAWPWMPLAPDSLYIACDIHQDKMDFLDYVLSQAGQTHECLVHDLLEGPPTHAVDLVLLLKTLPCLEQIDKRIGQRLLNAIDAPIVIVSYPVKSLGGQGKGMTAHYAAQFQTLMDELNPCRGWQISRFDFPTELVFRLTQG